jgi:hypothetical protein
MPLAMKCVAHNVAREMLVIMYHYTRPNDESNPPGMQQDRMRYKCDVICCALH